MAAEVVAKDGAAPRHARLLQPSAAARWLACPASVVHSMGVEDSGSVDALAGTQCHAYAAHLLAEKFGRADEFSRLEFAKLSKSCDEEQKTAALFYADVCESIVRGGSDEEDSAIFAIETAVDVSPITGEDGAAGTADFVCVKRGVLYVVDLKYGMRRVQVVENPQLFLYAAAVLRDLSLRLVWNPKNQQFESYGPGIRTVRMMIVQPRLERDAISTWELPVSEVQLDSPRVKAIREKADHARALAAAAKDGAAPADADYCVRPDVCRYCRGKLNCPAMRQVVVGSAPAVSAKDGAAIEIPMPDTLEGLAKARGYCDTIEQWVEAVRDRVQSMLLEGYEVPGWKLVEGRAGARRWDDEELVGRILRRKIGAKRAFVKKLVTPTAVERLKKKGEITDREWERIERHVTRADPKPVAVPSYDKREAYAAAKEKRIEASFDDLSKVAVD